MSIDARTFQKSFRAGGERMKQAGSGVHAGPTARLLMLLASVCVAEVAEERVMSSAASVGEM